jgi:geranylgeranyl reductase family protein
MIETYDVIVIGAGPAGCQTILHLADRGLRLLLLDQAAFPRWKPCAGGISCKAADLLPDFARDEFETEIWGAHFLFGPERRSSLRSGRLLGWMVRRESFDRAFFDRVKALPGVTVRTGARVRRVEENGDCVLVHAGQSSFRASAVVGADGANSVTSRAVPGHDAREMAMALEYIVRPAKRFDELDGMLLFDFGAVKCGYAWIFPKRDEWSVGAYVASLPYRALESDLRQFCKSSPFLQGAEILRRKGHLGPRGGSRRTLNTRRIILVGDAADLNDPLTGEGIYYALESGRLAAKFLRGFIADGALLDGYSRRVMKDIVFYLRRARSMASLLNNHTRAAFNLLLKNRVVCQKFLDVLAGRITYRQMARQVLTSAPRFLLNMRFGKQVELQLD